MPDSFATPWTIAHQACLSTGFPSQQYWSELPFSSSGNLPYPLRKIRIQRVEPASPALTGRFFTIEPPGKPYKRINITHTDVCYIGNPNSYHQKEKILFYLLNVSFFLPSFFFFFWSLGMFPNQGQNPGPGSESPES